MTTLKINKSLQIVDIDITSCEVIVGQLYRDVDGCIKFRVNPLREALTEDEQVKVGSILLNVNSGQCGGN